VHPFKKGYESGYQLRRTSKVTLEGLCKENTKKDVKIKHQNERIVDLTKKLEKRPLKASNKGSQSKAFNKESNYSEDCNKEHQLKKNSSLHSLSLEQIQSLVGDVVKLQLGEGS